MRLLSVARLLVLANLLGRESLGQFGLALVLLTTVDALSEPGLRHALVQRPALDRRHLDTTWTVQAVRGAVLAAALFVGAPLAASFFDEPSVAPIVRAIALVPLLAGLTNVGMVQFQRSMKFRPIALAQASTTLVDFIVTVAAALAWRSVWALVIGKVTATVWSVVISHVLIRTRLKMGVDRRALRGLRHFGSWIFASTLLAFLAVNAGDLIVARTLPVAALAVYQLAMNLGALPLTEIASIINGSSFPAFSRLHDDREQLRSLFLRSFALIAAFVSLGTALLWALSADLISVVLAPEWSEVGLLVPWLAIWGASRALGASNSSLLQAVGKPKLATYFQFVLVILLALTLYPMGERFGLRGIAIALAGCGAIVAVLRYGLVARVLGIRPSRLYFRVLGPVLASTAGVLASGLLNQYFRAYGLTAVSRLALCSSVVLIVFGAAIALWDRQFETGLARTVRASFTHLMERRRK